MTHESRSGARVGCPVVRHSRTSISVASRTTEAVDVFLVFDVLETSSGASFHIADLLVR